MNKLYFLKSMIRNIKKFIFGKRTKPKSRILEYKVSQFCAIVKIKSNKPDTTIWKIITEYGNSDYILKLKRITEPRFIRFEGSDIYLGTFISYKKLSCKTHNFSFYKKYRNGNISKLFSWNIELDPNEIGTIVGFTSNNKNSLAERAFDRLVYRALSFDIATLKRAYNFRWIFWLEVEIQRQLKDPNHRIKADLPLLNTDGK